VNSYRTKGFRKLYNALPVHIKRAADKAYELWRSDSSHPSLHFKPIPERPATWSVRITKNYRAVCMKLPDGWLWYGIGDHDYFDSL
jgi:hypothetical protein